VGVPPMWVWVYFFGGELENDKLRLDDAVASGSRLKRVQLHNSPIETCCQRLNGTLRISSETVVAGWGGGGWGGGGSEPCTRAHICESSGKHRYFVRTLHIASCVRPVILELLAEIPLAKRSPHVQQSAPNAARLPEILGNQ
jgi:hypothetical protein